MANDVNIIQENDFPLNGGYVHLRESMQTVTDDDGNQTFDLNQWFFDFSGAPGDWVGEHADEIRAVFANRLDGVLPDQDGSFSNDRYTQVKVTGDGSPDIDFIVARLQTRLMNADTPQVVIAVADPGANDELTAAIQAASNAASDIVFMLGASFGPPTIEQRVTSVESEVADLRARVTALETN